MKHLILLFFSLIIISCQPTCSSHVKSQLSPRSPQNVTDLMTYTDRILNEAQNETYFNDRTCAIFINTHADFVEKQEEDGLFPKSRNDIEFLKENGVAIQAKLFELRMLILEKFKLFKNPSAECVSEVRRASRYTRFVEDLIVEWLAEQKIITEAPGVFKGKAPQTMLNNKKSVEFQPGDVLLMRGFRPVSAAIARIGDDPSDFSHIGIIGLDAQNQQHLVEALIETGSYSKPMSNWVKEDEARVVLLRHHNPEIAKRAAKAIYAHVQSYKKKNNKNIPYDFAMNWQEHSKLYCAEVASFAYELATGRQTDKIPMYLTSFSKIQDSEFFKNFGIRESKTFAPTDIEIDPNFTIVAEHRMYSRLKTVRFYDVTTSSIFKWMLEKGYTFQVTDYDRIKAAFVAYLGELGFLPGKIPPDISAQLIGTVFGVEALSKILMQRIELVESKHKRANGRTMTYKEMELALEAYRIEDCVSYEKAVNSSLPLKMRQPEFHYLFRPKGKCSKSEGS